MVVAYVKQIYSALIAGICKAQLCPVYGICKAQLCPGRGTCKIQWCPECSIDKTQYDLVVAYVKCNGALVEA